MNKNKLRCFDCINKDFPTQLCYMENGGFGKEGYCKGCPCQNCWCIDPEKYIPKEKRPKFQKKSPHNLNI